MTWFHFRTLQALFILIHEDTPRGRLTDTTCTVTACSPTSNPWQPVCGCPFYSPRRAIVSDLYFFSCAHMQASCTISHIMYISFTCQDHLLAFKGYNVFQNKLVAFVSSIPRVPAPSHSWSTSNSKLGGCRLQLVSTPPSFISKMKRARVTSVPRSLSLGALVSLDLTLVLLVKISQSGRRIWS